MAVNPYFCQVCFGQITSEEELKDSYALEQCGHRFCRQCLISYLETSINNAVLQPRCFFLSSLAKKSTGKKEPSSSSSSSSSSGNSGGDSGETSGSELAILEDDLTNEVWEPYNPEVHAKCNRIIPKNEVYRILSTYNEEAPHEVKSVTLIPSSDKKEPPTAQVVSKVTKGEILSDRLDRFEIMKGNKNARECPSCHFCQVIDVNQKGQRCEYLSRAGDMEEAQKAGTEKKVEYPLMHAEDVMCENPLCNHVYCFHHSDAHQGKTCEQYRKENAQYDAESQAFIDSMSKNCPGCGIPVSKMEGGGCNHMKCPDCGCAFCWLCGQEIEDTVFPSHFAYWNLQSRCTNMQMDPNLEVTTWSRIVACVTTYGERLVLGPLAAVSTIVSLLLCCCCIPVMLHQQVDSVQYGNTRSSRGSGGGGASLNNSERLLGEMDSNSDSDSEGDKDRNGHDGEDLEAGVGADAVHLDEPISDFDGPATAQKGGNGLGSSSILKSGVSGLLDAPLEVGQVEVSLDDLRDVERGPVSESETEGLHRGKEEEVYKPVEEGAAPIRRDRPSTGRAIEILLGNCMSGWSLIWGIIIIGVPSGLLALAGGVVMLVIYLLYFITLLVEYVLNLYKFWGAQQSQIADPASTLAPAEETSSGDFAPTHASDEEAGGGSAARSRAERGGGFPSRQR